MTLSDVFETSSGCVWARLFQRAIEMPGQLRDKECLRSMLICPVAETPVINGQQTQRERNIDLFQVVRASPVNAERIFHSAAFVFFRNFNPSAIANVFDRDELALFATIFPGADGHEFAAVSTTRTQIDNVVRASNCSLVRVPPLTLWLPRSPQGAQSLQHRGCHAGADLWKARQGPIEHSA